MEVYITRLRSVVMKIMVIVGSPRTAGNRNFFDAKALDVKVVRL